jgi:hypothetical protein
MANVAHASLTGTELHEPKGADTAGLGTVYVADGAGSGNWNNVGTSAFTGMIADFPAIVAPAGWLEADGSVISTTTYSGLFAVMSVTTSGTRTNGSPIITSIASTTTYKAGYYVFGTGINTGTTILTVDSPTQITLSANATSSGTSSFFVSPWLMDTGTVQLPDLTTVGRFRRSRSSTTKVGDVQVDQNKAHTHTLSGTTNDPGGHVHASTVIDTGHTHTLQNNNNVKTLSAAGGSLAFASGGSQNGDNIEVYTSVASNTTGITLNNVSGGAHTHTVSGTAVSDGGTEGRPLAVVFLTCIKT